MQFLVLVGIFIICPEACDRTHMRQHMPKSIYMYENSYVQISITDIASCAQKLSSQS